MEQEAQGSTSLDKYEKAGDNNQEAGGCEEASEEAGDASHDGETLRGME